MMSHHELLEYYVRLGFIGSNGDLEVYIMTDDLGYIPHFHIRDRTTRGKYFNTCIELSTNRYFMHGSHKSKLNAKQMEELAEFIESPCKTGKYKSNYELAVDMWNLNNSNVNIEFNGSIPNYRIIE